MSWAEFTGAGTLLIAIIGGLLARDRMMMRSITEAGTRANKLMAKGNAELHNRVDEVHSRINDVKDSYVKSSELIRVEQSVADMRKENREYARDTTQRLDALLANLKKSS